MADVSTCNTHSTPKSYCTNLQLTEEEKEEFLDMHQMTMKKELYKSPDMSKKLATQA
jgi:hypothetical protein